jgi:hypothetical protein
MVRPAMAVAVPWRRVPSLKINVSADATVDRDTTDRLIAAAMTILRI